MTDANELRDQGNQAFKEGQFQQAIDRYTDALNALQDLQVSDTTKTSLTKCHSNRAQCYINLNQYDDAIEDATRGKFLESPVSFILVSLGCSFGIYTSRSEIVVPPSECLRTFGQIERSHLRCSTIDVHCRERWTK